MATLDNKTLKDFAQAVLGATGPTSTIKYGTVTMGTDGPHVILDGSTSVTPVVTNMDVRSGDRVMVDIINHTAVITGNVTSPPSGRSASEQPARVYTVYAVNQSTDTPPISGWTELMPPFEPDDVVWERMLNEYPDGYIDFGQARVIYGDGITTGKDAVIMDIMSSNGTSFRETTDSTILNSVLIKGGTQITDKATARRIFGSTFDIGWQYKQAGESAWTPIFPTDSRLVDDGFGLSLSYNDVRRSTTFRCIATIVDGSVASLVGESQITLDNITNGYTHGLTAYAHTFVASNPNGARIGDTFSVSAYLFNGTKSENITISSVTDPEGMSHTTTYNGTDHPTVTYKVTSQFISDRSSTIKYVYNNVTFTQTITFAVAPMGSSGKDGEDGIDGTDGFVYGIKQPFHIFTGGKNGAVIGDTCTAELYAREGRIDRVIMTSLSEISCPTGIRVKQIVDNQTQNTKVIFEVSQQFDTQRQALIGMYVGYVRYEVAIVFGVAKDGQDGQDGEDGQDGHDGTSAYGLVITTSNGTVFTERHSLTVLSASIYYGTTQLTVRSDGTVYNDTLQVGRLYWTKTNGSSWVIRNEYTITATECLPSLIVGAQLRDMANEVCVNTEVCLVFCSNISVAKRYYYKRATSQGEPSKPTTFPPSENWIDTEPAVSDSEISTTTLWYVEVVEYSDGSFVYSDVAEYTAFVSSKHALSQALAAIVAAEMALDDSEKAKEDAYEALVAATAYLKLDPVLQKIVISKLGENGWSTAAIDSNGFEVGEYDPVYHTYYPYASLQRNGVTVFSGPDPTAPSSTHFGSYSITDGENGDRYDEKKWCIQYAHNGRIGGNLHDYTNCDHRYGAAKRTYTIKAYDGVNEPVCNYMGSAMMSVSGGQYQDPEMQRDQYTRKDYYIASVLLATTSEHEIADTNSDTAEYGHKYARQQAGMFLFMGDQSESVSATNMAFLTGLHPVYAIGGNPNKTLRNVTPQFVYAYNLGTKMSDSRYRTGSPIQPMFLTKGSLPLLLEYSNYDYGNVMNGYYTGQYFASLGYAISCKLPLGTQLVDGSNITPVITVSASSPRLNARRPNGNNMQLSVKSITANTSYCIDHLNVTFYVESASTITNGEPLILRPNFNLLIEFT